MNQRDQNRGGRGGRYGSMRGEEGRYGDDREREQERERPHRSWTERLSSGFRDTYNPEPQWLREDRERSAGGDYEREDFGRGSYAGSGREWGESRGEFGQRYGSAAGHERPMGEREREQREHERQMRHRQRGEQWRDEFRDEPWRGAQRGGALHDLSTGWEPARWQGDDYFSGNRGYGGFRVGTGMGLASDDYMRPTFGRSYGDASGYGSRGGYDLGTHQRDVAPRSFRGLGPQSYKRPDERIRDDVYERLTDSHMIDARYILVEVNQGNVTLTGTVGERRMRYAAEDVVAGVLGVANINNQLKVQRESPQSPSTGTPSGSMDDENKRH